MDNLIIFEKKEIGVGRLAEITSELKRYLTKGAVLLLNGDIAAGKTTLVATLVEQASSPTYALHQVYSKTQLRIDHFDLYRLSNADEIETSGVWEALHQKDNLVIIEWSQKISLHELPKDRDIFQLDITIKDENSRNYKLSRLF